MKIVNVILMLAGVVMIIYACGAIWGLWNIEPYREGLLPTMVVLLAGVVVFMGGAVSHLEDRIDRIERDDG